MFNRKTIEELKSQIESAHSNISDLYKTVGKMSKIQGILVSELLDAKMKDTALVSCPFCGSTPTIDIAETTVTKYTEFWCQPYKEEALQYSISCSKLDCVCLGTKGTDFDSVVRKWNGRS